MKAVFLHLVVLFISFKAFGQRLLVDSNMVVREGIFHVYTESIGKDRMVIGFKWKKIVSKHDTIGTIALHSIELADVDRNGYPDIILTYTGNNDTQNLLLFDPQKGRFRELEGYDEFSFSERLKGSHDLYWSYHRSGCADNNWESHLFRISKFRITHLGKMIGVSCSEKSSERTVTIFRRKSSNPESWTLKAEFQYDHVIHQLGRKWAFMEKYWIAHKGEFEQ